VRGEEPLIGWEGAADLLQGGVEGGPWGLWDQLWGRWGEQWGLCSSCDMIGHLGRFVVGGCPPLLLIH